MAFQYPAKPWVDGQEIKINFQGKEVVIAKYDASKNLWLHLRVNDAGTFKYVTSCEVILNRDCSDPCIPNIEWDEIDNLQTALDYLYYWLFDESNGAIPRLDRLEDKVEDLDDLYNQLLQLINNLGGLQDFENLLTALAQIVQTLEDHEERIKDLEDNWRDRAPIVSVSPPTKHPDFGSDPLKVGDFWIDAHDQIFYWNGTEWTPTYSDPDRPPTISDPEPTKQPKFPGQPLEKGDFWIDNHEGRAFTPLYYWTGTEWEELEHDENWDEELKKHTCAQFYKKVYDYNAVQGKEGHFCSAYNFGNDRVKWWTSPAGKGFYNNGDTIWVNDQGPYVLEEFTEDGKWTTFFLPGSIQPADGTIVKFSKIPKLCDTSFNDDRYVLKAGDSMTGALVMQDANIDFIIPGESLKDANGDPILEDDGKGNMVEQWDDSIDRFSHIESLPPRLLRSDGTYGSDTSAPFGIRVEIDDGNTYGNRFAVGNRHGDAVTVTGGTGPNVQFGTGFQGNQNPPSGEIHWESGEEGGVKITNIPTPTKEHPDSSLAVNKGYVDTRDEELRQGIIELEEEIDAIAPSVERGKWRFTAVGTVANPGQFTMYDDAFGSGQPTGLFKSAKSIWFNAVDSDGVAHAFGDVDDGELLEIFVDGSPEYGLYEVVGQAHDETQGGSSFWVIDVNFVRTNEDTTTVGPGELCRFKVFMAPTGGDAGNFVLKTGDTMEGPSPLVFKTKETGFNYNNPPTNTSYLKFLNDKNGSITSVNLWLGGNVNTLTTDQSFMARGSIYTKEYYYAYGTSSTSNPRIRLQSSTGSLQSGTTVALQWDSTGVKKILAKSSEGSSGYVLRLDSNKVPYWSSPPMPTYTITKSNGNYYVS